MPPIESVIEIAKQAGELVLRYYAQGKTAAEKKADDSPVTRADREADAFIRDRLRALAPEIPCVSEESDIPDYETRKDWKRFWLVDPLDGTKDFLAGNNEFTVNIALIEDKEPVLGVVHVPALGLVYYAEKGKGSWKREDGAEPQRIYSDLADPTGELVVVESRQHPSQKLEAFLKDYRIKSRLKAGSAFKFCLVAEGTADIYPRLGPTMEWDVAAGDCVYRDSARQGRHPSTLAYNTPSLKGEGFVIGLRPRHTGENPA